MQIEVTHKGWMLFCPIWWCDDLQMPIPRHAPGFLLEICMGLQYGCSWVLAQFDLEADFVVSIKKIAPFTLELPEFEQRA